MTWDPNYKWANPTANWQQTYQNSQWARKPMMPMQYPQMPQQQMPQQQYPQFNQQQLSSFMNFMQSKPLSSFMNDPRYQPISGSNTYQPSKFNPEHAEQNIAQKILYAMNNGFFRTAR